MANNCTGIFRPCLYPSCFQSCIVPHAQALYAYNDGTGAPGGYNRPCTCGRPNSQYTSTLVSMFYTNENGCVASNYSPSNQDLFWTTWVNLCLEEGYNVPTTLIPAKVTLGPITTTAPSASTTAVSSTTTQTPMSSAAPAAGQNTFSTADIIGTTLGVIGVIPNLNSALLFTYRKSPETDRRELRWRRGKKNRVFRTRNTNRGNNVHVALNRGGTMIYNEADKR